MKKLGRILAAALVLLLVIAGVAWFNEIKTVLSIKQIAAVNTDHKDGGFYTVEVSGGYYFDEFLEQHGASSDEELANFITSSLTKGIIASGELSAGCTSFTCGTLTGDRLLCRNFDMTASNSAIIYTKPEDGRYASFSTSDMKYVGIATDATELSVADKVRCLALSYAPMDGMNEKGLAVSIYISNQGTTIDENGFFHTVRTDISTYKPDITSTTMLRMVLDYCATVDEAIELIKQYDLHDSSTECFHYCIADASGKAVCLEWLYGNNKTDITGTNRELTITYSNGTEPLVISNYVMAEGYYDDDKYLRGADRVRDVKAALAVTDNVVEDENSAMQILKVAAIRSRVPQWQADDTVNVTRWSVVYNMTDKTVMLCANEHFYDNAYTFTYSFDDFINAD